MCIRDSDITNFQVAADDENVIFRFTMAGPVDNVWDGANGLSLQTFDIYVDQDGDGAVSYTHLDVYKRQAPGRRGEGTKRNLTRPKPSCRGPWSAKV